MKTFIKNADIKKECFLSCYKSNRKQIVNAIITSNNLFNKKFSTHNNYNDSKINTSNSKKRIVITGIGVVSPLGNSLPETFKNIKEGKSGITLLNKESYFRHLPKSYKIGALVDKAYFKNNKEFRTLGTDNLLTQITMSSFLEAIKDANLEVFFNGEYYKSNRVAVITGTSAPSLNCITENTTKAVINDNFNLLDRMGMLKLMTNLLNFNISQKYKFTGPTMALSLSCASGLNAIGEGMKMILNDESDISVCGSSEANVGPFLVHSMNKLGTLYKDTELEELIDNYLSNSNIEKLNILNGYLKTTQRPFDLNRKGIILGEGSGMFILEELEHALKRKAKIYCEVVGYSTNGDSYHLTKPKESGEGGFISMLSSLNNSNIGAKDIDIISCHATSTDVGDIAELNSILSLFASKSLQESKQVREFYNRVIKNGKRGDLEMELKKLLETHDTAILRQKLMASKTQIGHLLGAAGSVETAIAVKCLEEGVIIDNCNSVNVINNQVNFRNNNGKENFSKCDVRYMLKNSFAFGGVNSTLVFKNLINEQI